jgi:hydrogenase-4 membrane subunit HyfE
MMVAKEKLDSNNHDEITLIKTYGIKIRRLLFWIIFFAFFPACFSVGIGTRSETATIAFGIFWLALFIVSSLTIAFAHCPSCGKLFHHHDGHSWNPWAKQCMNCGFSLKQPGL